MTIVGMPSPHNPEKEQKNVQKELREAAQSSSDKERRKPQREQKTLLSLGEGEGAAEQFSS
jgi:hypothetical protein